MSIRSDTTALSLAITDLLAAANPNQLAATINAALSNSLQGENARLQYYDLLACSIVVNYADIRLVGAVGLALEYLYRRLIGSHEATPNVPYCKDNRRALMLVVAILSIQADNIANLPVYAQAVAWVQGRLCSPTLSPYRKFEIAKAVHDTGCKHESLLSIVSMTLDPRPA